MGERTCMHWLPCAPPPRDEERRSKASASATVPPMNKHSKNLCMRGFPQKHQQVNSQNTVKGFQATKAAGKAGQPPTQRETRRRWPGREKTSSSHAACSTRYHCSGRKNSQRMAETWSRRPRTLGPIQARHPEPQATVREAGPQDSG